MVSVYLSSIKVIDVGEPKRGDVIVFRYPPQPTISYIKRVIGLPVTILFMIMDN